jgi:hypothetical protein
MFMKGFGRVILALAFVVPLPALAASVTGEVTYIGPDADQVILNHKDVYAVAPGVSLDKVSVRQTITAEISDQDGTRTITNLAITKLAITKPDQPQAVATQRKPARSLKAIETKQPVRPKH